jgi:hypothetical protein
MAEQSPKRPTDLWGKKGEHSSPGKSPEKLNLPAVTMENANLHPSYLRGVLSDKEMKGYMKQYSRWDVKNVGTSKALDQSKKE